MQLSPDERRVFQSDLTTNTFAWLTLSQALDRTLTQRSPSTKEPLADQIDRAFASTHPASHLGSALFAVGLVFGIIGISSLIGYAKDQPANLWLIIGVFALWPFITALMSVVQDARPAQSMWVQSLFAMVKRGKHFPDDLLDSQKNTTLIQRWVAWKWQYFSISFTLGSLIGFLTIITFWDISFGWTSTLSNSQSWMAPLASWLTWPGHFYLGAPSNELLEASLLSRNASENAEILRQWWPYVFFSMFVYGLMSRLCLFAWKYHRLKSAIIADIRSSGVIERYNALTVEQKSVYSEIEVDSQTLSLSKGDYSLLSESLLLGWQFKHSTIELGYNFGAESWQVDLDWLKQNTAQLHKGNVLVLVNIFQTPVIELIDLVSQILESLNTNLVTIGLFIGENEASRAGRFEATWRQFSQKHPLIRFVILQEPVS
ncbi:DUF2868 domain-containing protein [Reinekea forsetii]|nr:DUF2868 domain-containing protein [Reinekea forsetii]